MGGERRGGEGKKGGSPGYYGSPGSRGARIVTELHYDGEKPPLNGLK